MFWRILNKDLRRKKGSNLILLIMVILSSLFLSGGAAMIILTDSSIEYFLDKAKVSDYYFLSRQDQAEEITDFLNDSNLVDGFTKSEYVQPRNDSVTKAGEKLDTGLLFFAFSIPPKEGSLIFDQKDHVVTSMKNGELGMSIQKAEKLGFKTGDQIVVAIGDTVKVFTLSILFKDAVLGSEYMSISNLIISDADYRSIEHSANIGMKMIIWGIQTKDTREFTRELSKSNLMVAIEFSRNAVISMYTMEQISSIMYMIVAVVLMFISFTLLRFTIYFTIEEDYREIGVMKAIGLRASAIRNIYVVKYLAIAVSGSIAGLLMSFPLTSWLISGLGRYMVLPTGNTAVAQRILCAAAIVLTILFFCRRATGKITKVSAIQAIREGSSGERFSHKGLLKLKGSSAQPAGFMAGNDILSNLRSYVSVFLALSAGIGMIALPANCVSTLRHGDTVQYFGFPAADLYSNVPSSLSESGSMTYEDLSGALDEIESHFAGHGFDVKANAYMQISMKIYSGNDADTAFPVSGYIPLRDETVKLPYAKGSPPELANEIGVSDIVLNKLGLNLGDTVAVRLGTYERRVLITGIMQSMSNGGDTVFLPYKMQIPTAFSAGVTALSIDFNNRNDVSGQISLAKESLPNYKLKTMSEYEASHMNSTISAVEKIVNMLTAVAAAIIFLVVFLIGSALLQKDKPSVVLLKSIGFNNRTLRKWQILRIMTVSVLAAFFGVLLSFALNGTVTRITFGMMGADHVTSHPNYLNILVIYPFILIACSLLSSVSATAGINKISMNHIGNTE